MSATTLQIWLSVIFQALLCLGILVGIIIQVKTQFDVHKIEVATNSMKDALVKAEGLAGEQRGRDMERDKNV